MTSQSKPYTFDRVIRIIIGLAIFAFIVWLINRLSDVLLPFCVASLIAYIFEPFVQFNRKLLHLKGRIVAVFITLFGAAMLFGFLAYLFVPSIITELHQVATILRQYANNTEISIEYLPPALHDYLRENIDFDNISHTLMRQDIRTLIDKCLKVVYQGFNVIFGIITWLIVLLYVVFIMVDYDRLMNGFKLMVPPRFRTIAYKLGNDVKDSMNHYFRGQALIACFVAVIYCVGFSICGLPLAIVLGIATGVLFMIPYFQYLSIIPVTLLCLVGAANGKIDFWAQWWECMSVFVVVQIVADLILTPKIMGKAMGLNPAIILLSLSIWGSLFGLIGMIIALPLTTLILSYYDQYIIQNKETDVDEPTPKPTQNLSEAPSELS